MEQKNMIYTVVRDTPFNSREINILEASYRNEFDAMILHENGMNFDRTKDLIDLYRDRRVLIVINGIDGLSNEDGEYIYEMSVYTPFMIVVPNYKWVPKNIGAVCNFDVTEETWKQMNRDLSEYFENDIELRDINNRKLSDLIETKETRYIENKTNWEDLF